MTNRINWIGIDDHADKLTVAQLVGSQRDPARTWEVPTTDTGLRQLVRWLKSLEGQVRCVYEAGPCGYELYRLLTSKGLDCAVAAPSLTPHKPGDRVKTNRRDARKLAELHRGGLLTTITVPDQRRESIRDLLRARDDARKTLTSARHRLGKFLLRHGFRYRDGKAWTARHWSWIRSITMPEPYQQLVLAEYLFTLQQRQAELARVDLLVADAAKEPDYATHVAYLRTLRGVDTLSAMTFLAEFGDLRRFPSAPPFMAAVGLVPSESSTGNKVHRYGITKTGNAHVRHVLLQAAWHYRHALQNSPAVRARRAGQPSHILTIAMAADHRLHRKFRRMIARGKRSTVAVTAVARELAGFVWSIGQQLPHPASS